MPKLRKVSLYTLETVFKILGEIENNPHRTRTFIEERIRTIGHDSYDRHIVHLLNHGLLYFPEKRCLRISLRGQKCLDALREAKGLLDLDPPPSELEKLGMRPHSAYATKTDRDWMRYIDESSEPHEPDSRPAD